MKKETYILNPNRIKYILQLYNLKDNELLDKLNSGKKKITLDILTDRLYNNKEIDLQFLKKLDTIFGKGLVWYISERDIDAKESSIFLRKDKFNSDLNFSARKIINRFEEQKLDVQLLSKLINYNLDRKIDRFSTTDDVGLVKSKIIEEFEEKEKELIEKNIIKPKANNDREYLERLIRIIESFNVFVFEFIEHKRTKDKSNFSGFFMKPNVIVIKRQQKYMRREIFTLLHEFAHYLINSEEIDEISEKSTEISTHKNNATDIEEWCNNFAFKILINNNEEDFNNLTFANKENNYYKEEINELYKRTYLSKAAYYTRLYKEKKISNFDYNAIYSEILDAINKEEAEKKLKELQNAELSKVDKKAHFGAPKPIQSNLFVDILRFNYFDGNIDQGKICKYLKIKGEKFNDYIY